MPERIQVRRVKGWTMPARAPKYVGRPTRYGNPFKVGERIGRESPLWPYIADAVPRDAKERSAITPLTVKVVVAAYGAWFVEQPALMLTARDDLAGRGLACWCRPPVPGEPDHCHARFLLGLVNDDLGER